MRPHFMQAALTAAAVSAFSFLPSAQLEAQVPDSIPLYSLEPIIVNGRLDDVSGAVPTASTGFIGARDLRLRPISREGELLEVVPGMILTQHSGSGKSNQMFVRGFNLDHGTDFSTRVEGMPVNLPTHAHGQGYTDLNFLVPEFVENVEYALGNYYPEIGDFGSAGGAHFRLKRRLDRPLFSAGAGANGHRRLLAAGSAGFGTQGTLFAGAEARGYDGPWEVPEDLRKLSGVVRYGFQGRTHAFSLLAMGYDSEWRASDQIPQRAIEQGLVSRFGQIDPTLGGESSRYSLSAGWTRSTRGGSQHVDVYAVRYALDLFSNFTYFLDAPAEGDQLRQVDDGRWTIGGSMGHIQPAGLFGRPGDLSVGLQLRHDLSDLTLARTSARATGGIVREDRVDQWAIGAFAGWKTSWSPSFRSVIGVRGDVHYFDVTALRAENTGTRSDAIVSPKLTLAWTAASAVELYASGGFGFHSNDARGTVTRVDPVTGDPVDPVNPLVASRGAELGARISTTSGLVTTATIWGVHLDSELVYVGDAGQVEPSDPSRRVGFTVANIKQISDEWVADLDLSVTRARFHEVTPGFERIPGALENVVAAGVTHEPLEGGVFGALRLRHLGAYPLTEDNGERGKASTLVNLNLGYQTGPARVTIAVFNLFDEADSDIQYFYSSRLSGEPAGGVEGLHLHPAEPRHLRLTLSWGL